MRHLVAFCLGRPITTLTLHICLLLIGAIAVTRLPLNSMPASERPVVNVNVEYPNASPQQVEQEVTRPVEEAVATLRGIQRLHSESEPGRSRVTAEFAWGTNLDLVKLEVRERLARVMGDLPVDDLERIRIRGAYGSGTTIIKGRISSKGVDLSQNYDLLVNRLQRPLERIDGVAQVEMDGVTPLEIQVTFRQEQLDRHGLQLREVIRRLEDNNVDLTVGEVIDSGKIRRLRVTNAFGGIDDVRNFPVNAEGTRLGQVAEVTEEEGDLRWGRHLNRSYAVSVEVTKESTANTVEVCAQVVEKIREIGRDPQLEGIDLLIWDNEGQVILDALQGLRNAGLLGSALALLILFAFLRRFTATLLVGMAIPISVLAALGCLYLLDRDLNVITMIALMLGVGMLVDTAVVVVESIVRVAGTGQPPRTAAIQGTMEVATPIFAATITSIVVFLPVVFGTPSRMTDYLVEMGLVIALTLTCSLFVSLTLIPMAAARIYTGRDAANDGWFSPVRRLYESTLSVALRHRGGTLAVTAALVASAVLPVRWGFEFNMADVSEPSESVSVYTLPEGSLDYRAMEKHVDVVEELIFAHHDELAIGDVYSWYKDNFAWTAVYPLDRSIDEAGMAKIRDRLDEILREVEIPGINVRTGDRGEFWGWGRRSRSAGTVSVRVFGDSANTLGQIIGGLQGQISTLPHVKSVERRVRDAVAEVLVRPDERQLSRVGLSSTDLSRTLEAGVAGQFLREIRTPDGDTRLRVALAEEEKDSLRELKRLRVDVGGRADVPIDELVEFEEGESAEELRRENRQSSTRLSVSVDPTKMPEARADIVQLLERYDWPKGYSYDLGMEWMQGQQNTTDFVLNAFLALFLVYLVMACLFESLSQPLALMVTVILAFPGVLWFLYVAGYSFDQPASIGLILLVGIVVNNGIVFIDHVNRYREQGFPKNEAIRRGGSERLRPIVITALTTIIGLLPMALGKAQAAGTYYFTLAFTIIGGLTVSTLLTLVVLPVLCSLIMRRELPGMSPSAPDGAPEVL